MPRSPTAAHKAKAVRNASKSVANAAPDVSKRRRSTRHSVKFKESEQEIKTYLTSSEAVARFPAIVRQVRRTKTRIYVEDKAGRYFMTIDPIRRFVDEPLIPIRVQTLRDNFSACAALIKRGFAFVVRSRGNAVPIFVRRHQRYQDPLDPVIDAWRAQVLAPMTAKALEPVVERLSSLQLAAKSQGTEMRSSIEEFNDSINGVMQAMRLAADRIFIGHHPFREGVVNRVQGHQDPDVDDLPTE